MANKKISELQSRTPVLADLMLVGDPSSGYAYKCTITALSTVIETAIGGNYVTLATTQTISGAKTFSNNVTLTSVQNAPTDPDKFLTLNASNVVTYRTGAEVLSDIGGQGSLTLTTTGTSGAATLVGNTLNIPNYAPDLTGYVPTSRTLTINGTAFDLSANRTWSVGTVTSVAATAGTGISISGSPITGSGTLTITNTAPDQTVVLTAGTGISVSGTYPNFTIAATSSATISGSGTTNYIPKFTSSSAIGNSNIYDQSGLIGIGTITPGSYNSNAYNLVVGGTSNAGITIVGDPSEGSSNLYLADGTTGNQAFRGYLSYTHNTDALTIGTAGTTRMTLDASGDLGLGLTPNTWGAGQIAFEFGTLGTLVSTGSAVSLQNNSYNNGTNNIRKVIGEASSYTQSGGAHIWQTAASGTSGSTISFSEVMRITSGGNLGLGVTPSAWGVTGKVFEFGGAGGSGSLFDNGVNDTWFSSNAYYNGSNWIYKSTGTATQYYQGNGHKWYTAPSGTAGNAISFTQAMTLDASGRLGIGTTSPQGRIHISGGYTGFEYNSAGAYPAYNTYFGAIGTNFSNSGSELDIWNTVGGGFAFRKQTAASTQTALMYISAAGNVGIGTSSPAANLDVQGTNSIITARDASGAVAFLQGVGNSDIRMGASSNHPLLIMTNSTERMRITSGGNVGIGTSSPSEKLEVYNGAIGVNNGTIKTVVSYSSIGLVGTTTNHDLAFLTNATEKARITSGGNVGIGTTSPNQKLTIADASYPILGFSIGSTAQGYIGSLAGGGIAINSQIAQPLMFYTNDTERMRITSGGDLGIGSSSPSGKIHAVGINATSANNVIYLENSAATVLFRIRNDGAFFTGTASSSPYNNTSGGSANLIVTSAGSLERATSSIKYKTDVRNYDKGIDIVKQMRPVYYKGKGKNDGDKQYAGLIAEEINELGLTEFVQYAKDGSPDALSYQNMIALLVKAIQEQQIEIDNLKNK